MKTKGHYDFTHFSHFIVKLVLFPAHSYLFCMPSPSSHFPFSSGHLSPSGGLFGLFTHWLVFWKFSVWTRNRMNLERSFSIAPRVSRLFNEDANTRGAVKDWLLCFSKLLYISGMHNNLWPLSWVILTYCFTVRCQIYIVKSIWP